MEKTSPGVTDDAAPAAGAANFKLSGMAMPAFVGPPLQFRLASSCTVDDIVQPSSEECEAYALYLHLPDLSHLQKIRSWPSWPNEAMVRPALHSLEMVFRMILSVLSDSRGYIDKEEWLRRLEALANSQIELISLICEGDCDAPASKQQSNAVCSIPTTSQGGVQSWQQKAGGSKSNTPVRYSQESLLPRMATWKRAQSLVTRIHFAIEGHMLRAPFTLGLGEPNLSSKPVLEYDQTCTPSKVHNCLQVTPGSSEDHALAIAHQIMESWLVVAQGLVKSVEERVASADSEGAANKCWILERVWKLFASTMDLLQVMDPDDFMKLKQKLGFIPKSEGRATRNRNMSVNGPATFCLRSTMLRTVTRACKELRSLVPKVVGVEVDPKGGPRLQEAIMGLFTSHGLAARGHPYGRPFTYHPGTVHLLQAFQAIEAAIRQFYFTYRQLVITVMGSGEYTGAIPGGDALLQLYSEPPYFPSVDGARTFLGDFWRHNAAVDDAAYASKQRAFERVSYKASSSPGTNSSLQATSTPLVNSHVQQQQMCDDSNKSNSAPQSQSQLQNFSMVDEERRGVYTVPLYGTTHSKSLGTV